MKALTILQPFAHLICQLTADDPLRKRVENRQHDRFKNYRGLLLIHAGLSKGMLWPYRPEEVRGRDRYTNNYGIPHDQLDFGAIVGAVNMVSHFEIGHLRTTVELMQVNGVDLIPPNTTAHQKIVPASERTMRPWLESHQHVEGKYCLVFENARKFREPIPCKGAQGIWNLPAELEERVKEQLEMAEVLP